MIGASIPFIKYALELPTLWYGWAAVLLATVTVYTIGADDDA